MRQSKVKFRRRDIAQYKETTMDVPEEEQDVKLQRASPELLADLQNSLRPFLWRNLVNGELRIRKRVRVRETDRLIGLLSPHQENPQLLDPHLETFLSALSDAFLEYQRSVKSSKKLSSDTKLLVPLSQAICKLLYTICKIRGEKIVVRFFSAEPKNLELLLSAIEGADDGSAHSNETSDRVTGKQSWIWEERYVTILWLSHLLLNPFDLVSISSAEQGSIERPSIPRMKLPSNLPGVASRVVPLAIKYLACAGKERDAAKSLLVRISTRKDMQELGLLHALVQWALSCLQSSAMAPNRSPYYYIGILSYLGGVLVSSMSTSDMDLYLTTVFRTVQAVSNPEDVIFQTIHTSALARKTVIKVLRTIVVLVLRPQYQLTEESDIVETAIGYMLVALSDNDTPVRLAASKALSIITLKLPSNMALQVVEAVLSALDHNVLAADNTQTRDLSSVNALEWHGLILTLSHLLYRRSPPASSLPAILHALIMGLTFEQRSTSGNSIGTNVRDAACFGIWALARRYSTKELTDVEASSVVPAMHHHRPNMTMIQNLASELVVSASLDSAGNIRRGASAALQELIGRHPDTVDNGIMVVQVVDYHAVALRSRAVLEVTPNAALLSGYYEDGLLKALLDWRGAGDAGSSYRRTAAAAVGVVVRGFGANSTSLRAPAIHPLTKAANLIRSISVKLQQLKPRDADRRHGYLLSMAEVISSISRLFMENKIRAQRDAAEITKVPKPTNIGKGSAGHSKSVLDTIESILAHVLDDVYPILNNPAALSYRKLELYAEGISRLISALCLLLLVKNKNIDSQPELLDVAIKLVTSWLSADEKDVMDVTAMTAVTDAAFDMLKTSSVIVRQNLLDDWISKITKVNGFLKTIVKAFDMLNAAQCTKTCNIILELWQAAHNIIEIKVAILKILTSSTALNENSALFVRLLSEGLDDFRTDGRGDIGSLVRIEALKAMSGIFASISWTQLEANPNSADEWFGDQHLLGTLLGKVLRLAGEKLDKVRTEAKACLVQLCHDPIRRTILENYQISSLEFFMLILNLQINNYFNLPAVQYMPQVWRLDIFEGIVTSADAGSEDIMRASRAALVQFCEATSSDYVLKALFDLAKKHGSSDRVLAPTIEVLSFLFDMGIMQNCELKDGMSWKSVYVLVQRAHYKSNNIRKLDACVRLYGGLISVYPEAIEKLTSMLLHPYPQVRNRAADVIFVTRGLGKGVNWLVAKKENVAVLKAQAV